MDSEESSEHENASSGGLSFGALAKAQAVLDSPNLKRNQPTISQGPTAAHMSEHDKSSKTRRRLKDAQASTQTRSSKHAPAIQSALKPVSRKRMIFEPSSAKGSRDPRFDPTITSSNRSRGALDRANKNYAFLYEYQASEMQQLKVQIKRESDPEVVAGLKRQLMSMEAKVHNAEDRQRENEIKKRHSAEEKDALRSGQKSRPYYLKKADVKRQAREEKLQKMTKKAREKAAKRQRKRQTTKEVRNMPRTRREG